LTSSTLIFKHILETLNIEVHSDTDMPAKPTFNPEKIRQRKRAIGIVAVVFLVIFTVLAIAQIITFIEWLLGDLVVAGVANLLLRRIGRTTPS
jgi:hypothetical protein